MPVFRRALLGSVLAAPALAQGLARPIRFIAPYAPGGGIDTTARLLAGPMGAKLGQPLIVENRAGAGGSLGAAEVARSAPDGHTVMVDALAHTVNPHLIRNLPFDYATAFTPISQVVVLPQILIVPNALPARTLAEFVALLKARPGAYSYGSSGNATAAHLASALFLERAQAEMIHVPYRGGTAALPDLIAGTTSMIFATVSSGLQLVREGRVRALGVTTTTRIAPLPDVPTIAEQGYPGYELNEWNGFYGPAGMSPALVTAFYEALQFALADATVQARLDALGAIPVGTPPAEFATYVRAQREAMGRLVREARVEI
ncbi:Bug family tripartite tricarboxylate transporter substrate binding protein [Plastoroseomonas arctica]|uniref:Twin-arginine translocation pathway signal protein n=1 Tax=Plastoroseomonas arctica TaxID=1509237 RepID=A0AAF1KU92_9PROT|nr:tripartite tricarboxylate transporter substrate-binding protein [Plastoroseomonas arctica]MBR0655752.1 twin-arginine translocation pathway signal protein [Plastoroseomonas arctica]